MRDPQIGAWVKVGASQGSDQTYNGRVGKVVEATPELLRSSVRGQLAPEQFIAVHFWPRNNKERKRGSPMTLLCPDSLKPTAAPTATGEGNER